MNRDYTHFNTYLNELIGDIYEQPIDKGHSQATHEVLDNWLPKLVGCRSVVDMGCGQIAPQSIFESYGIDYTGVAIGKDYTVARDSGKNVRMMDMTFTDFPHNSFDMVYSRHSLEHSPFPLLTMMEWHRIAKSWMLVVLPSPQHHKWTGINHYGVMNDEQFRFFLDRSGWKLIWDDFSHPEEYRYLCEKVKRI